MATKTNVTPLFDNVLIKPVQSEPKSVGGIYLPENVKEKPQLFPLVLTQPKQLHCKKVSEIAFRLM